MIAYDYVLQLLQLSFSRCGNVTNKRMNQTFYITNNRTKDK